MYAGLPRLPLPGEEVWAATCSILPGGTYITAAALHRLGVSCVWATSFGTDPFSAYVLSCARSEGLDEVGFTMLDHQLPNISTSLSFGSDRSFVSFGGSSEADTGGLIRRLRPRVVALPGLGTLADTRRWVDAAYDVGAIVFLDPQSTDQRLDTPGMMDLLARVAIFAPNEREAMWLTGASSPEVAAAMLGGIGSLVLIKRGADGVLAVRGDRMISAPALPGIRPVDTTGAGDCFNAAFIASMLAGEPIETCLDIGNIAGGMSTLAPGSHGIPTKSVIESQIRAHH
ncbi:MAG: carbohydrate kinase family protein [Chloroflexota bacterium]